MSRLQQELDASFTAPSIYSTYICREPVGDVALLINNGPDEYTSLLRTLQRSADHWAEKDHIRTVERLQLEIARLHMRNRQWQRAMRTLVPLWQTLSWRRAGWWNMLEEVDWALKECASSVRDAETMVVVEWELMNRSLTKRQDSHMDFRQALESLNGTQARPRSVVRSENILSCVSAMFAFSIPEGNVGVPLESQLVLSSHAHANSVPINLAQVRIAFEGGLKNINIHHRPREGDDKELAPGLVQLQRISLQASSSESEYMPTSPTFTASQSLSASADLMLAPGETRVITFTNIPRDAGDVEVSSITAYVKEEDFDLELIISEDEHMHQDSYWVSGTSRAIRKALKAERSSAVKIMPKPPKMRMSLPSMLNMYYVGEDTVLDLDITNEEDEPARGTLNVRLLGPPGMHARLAWLSESEAKDPLEEATLEGIVEDGHQRLPARQISVMEPSAQQKHRIRIQSMTEAAEYSLQIEARYSLLSDPETPISKIFNTDLVFAQPFEATFSFAPRVHPDPWPNYFDIEAIDEHQRDETRPKASGLIQRWSLTSRLTSLATDNLIIEDISPKVNRMTPPGTATCRIYPSDPTATAERNAPSKGSSTMAPRTLQSHTHTLDIQKLELEDRHSFSLDLALQIRYRRQSAPSPTSSTITTLHIPPLPLAFSEPRCLASSYNPSITPNTPNPQPIPLSYTLENPSSYSLTFALSMDNNEEFAFSGPKSLAIQLLPLSRRTIEYNLLPLEATRRKEDEWGRWIWPHCVVIDTGFRKTLRVLPSAEGVRGGKRGEVGVWIGGRA